MQGKGKLCPRELRIPKHNESFHTEERATERPVTTGNPQSPDRYRLSKHIVNTVQKMKKGEG